MKNGFFSLSLSVYYYGNIYASFDIKDNTDMIKLKKFKTDSPILHYNGLYLLTVNILLGHRGI